jgi:uncharacterized protein YndB with AHSA1/START domain
MSNHLHQEIVFKTTPSRVYEALTDASLFSKITGGAPTEISQAAGGAFSCFGGMISGRNIELTPNKLVVQAWRAGDWSPGVYSIVRLELQERGANTKLVLDHVGFPEGNGEHLDAGWKANYWEPLQKFLAE